ncbi:MAG TPA: hypothetical protein VGL46_12655 [Pseudonocardiaceae bacterium]|jgi:hypothetical protein
MSYRQMVTDLSAEIDNRTYLRGREGTEPPWSDCDYGFDAEIGDLRSRLIVLESSRTALESSDREIAATDETRSAAYRRLNDIDRTSRLLARLAVTTLLAIAAAYLLGAGEVWLVPATWIVLGTSIGVGVHRAHRRECLATLAYDAEGAYTSALTRREQMLYDIEHGRPAIVTDC